MITIGNNDHLLKGKVPAKLYAWEIPFFYCNTLLYFTLRLKVAFLNFHAC